MERHQKYLAILTSLILVSSALWYSALIIENQIRPVVATFTLAVVYFIISEVTYWGKHPQARIVDNIALHSAFVNVSIIFVTLLLTRLRDENLVGDFNNFHYMCLLLSGGILLVWLFTKKHVLSYLLIQVVAVIAYMPMFWRIFNTNIQTESNILWIAILTASVVAIPPTVRAFKEKRDWLGLVYLGRAITINVLTVYFVAAKDYGWRPF